MKRQHKDGLNIDRDMAFSSKCETRIFEFQTREGHTGHIGIQTPLHPPPPPPHPCNEPEFYFNFLLLCFLHHSYKLNVLCSVDLEQREDAARVNKENDEMAAKNLQAEVS